MKIAIAGGSGFVGTPLVQRLAARGHDVLVLTRDPGHVKTGRPVLWDGKSQGAWSGEVADADAVINLAGENIGAGRWTADRKRRLIDSRIEATHALAVAMRTRADKPRTFISASGIGYYGLTGDEVLDENAPRGTGLLADLSARWEQEARLAEDISRLVILRFAMVLGDGGALKKMLLPFRLGLGGPLGNGRQWMSWVDREDVLRIMEWALDHASARGVYNVAAPEPVRNREFTRVLGHVLHRPALLPAPAFALRIALGDMADELLLGGQRAAPKRAETAGFRFEYPTVEASLRHVLNR